MTRLVIGASDFKALSSGTRVRIIKLLAERNHTMTELARKLEMSTPSIKQHLDLLEQNGLVSLQDDGHKWKYYALTKKSRKLLEPEEPNFVVVLASSILGLAGLGALLLGLLGHSVSFMSASSPALSQASRSMADAAKEGVAGGGPLQATVPEALPAAAHTATQAAAAPDALLLAVGVVLLVLALVLSRRARPASRPDSV